MALSLSGTLSRSWVCKRVLRASPCGWSLAAALSLAAVPHAAEARDRSFRIDIPAGPLAGALTALASQTGMSFGIDGPLPGVDVPGLKGTMTGEEALRRLLTGTSLAPVRIGDGSYRLVRRPSAPPPAPAAALPAPLPPPEQPEIIVTGLKQPQPLFRAPAAISVVSGEVPAGGAPSFGSREVAAQASGLTLTNLGEGRNRQFIRGVADSPFNGYSQSTVSIAIDDARITYDAADPDLRLVDVDRIEILKGPQGPLYGTGALGGVYRIVTRRPDLAAVSSYGEVYGKAMTDGGEGGGISAVANLPLVTGSLGLRASVYAAAEPGWIDDRGARRDVNSGDVVGGRIALRWSPRSDWTIDVQGVGQRIKSDDSQYVPLMEEAYSRPAGIAEPHSNILRAIIATVNGR